MAIASLHPGEVARYVHASIYDFQPAAVRDAIKLLSKRTIASPETWSLDYDTPCESFVLTCHNADGYELNDQLREVLEELVENELNAAESSDREPLIVQTGKYYAFADMNDTNVEPSSDDGSASQSSQSARSVTVAHVIEPHGIGFNGKVKPVRTKGLPFALQARARHQSIPDNAYQKLSFRLVRWDETTQEHVFNARIGEALTPMSHDDASDCEYILEVAYFKPRQSSVNIRKQSGNTSDFAADDGEMDWEFEGDQPSVQQWLAGMGKTRRVDYLPPDAEPEASRDAVNFTGGASQLPVVGRLRVPKGVPLAALLEEDESQALEQTERQLDSDFAQLMRRKASSDDSSSGGEDQSAVSSDYDEETPSSFAALMKGNDPAEPKPASQETVRTKRPSMVVVSPPKPPPKPFPQALTGKSVSGSAPTTHNTTVSDGGFPTYNRRYAKVDGIGLSGDAANQALWEHENNLPAASVTSTRTWKTRQQLQWEREATAANPIAGSAAMSISEGRDLYIRDRSGDAVSTTPMSYAETKLGGEESWARNVVPPSRSDKSGYLVDVQGGDGLREVPLLPPALFPPLASLRQQMTSAPPELANAPLSSAYAPTEQASTVPKSCQQLPVMKLPPRISHRLSPMGCDQATDRVEPRVDLRSSPPKTDQNSGVYGSVSQSIVRQPVSQAAPTTENLIEFDASESWPTLKSPRPIEKLPSQTPMKPKVLRLTAPVQVQPGSVDADRVVERLRPTSEDKKPKLRRTMRQKAQKKGSKKKSGGKAKAKPKATKPWAILELPDAPPPLKAKKEPVTEKPADLPLSATTRKVVDGGYSADRSVFHQKLTEMLPAKPKLDIQFGMIFMDDTKGLASSKAAKVPVVQAVLDDLAETCAGAESHSTHFLSVLAKETVDVAYLLRVPRLLAPEVYTHHESTIFAFCDSGYYGIHVQIVYEIEIVDEERNTWTFAVDQDDFDQDACDQGETAVLAIKPALEDASCVYLHCPLSVWDARVRIKDKAAAVEADQPSAELAQAVMTFIKTFNAPGESPGFEADISEIGQRPAFSVSKIFAKRLYTQRLPLALTATGQDLSSYESEPAGTHAVWHVDQVWDLHISCGDSRQGEPSITAFAIAEDSMKAEGRLWFEASLHLDQGLRDIEREGSVEDAETAKKTLQDLETLVNRIVDGLDCVGLGGLHAMSSAELMRVPQQPKKVGKKPKREKEPDYVPYW